MKACEKCGCDINEENAYYVDDSVYFVDEGYYCPQCYDKLIDVCATCGQWHAKGLLRLDPTADVLCCANCTERLFVTELACVICRGGMEGQEFESWREFYRKWLMQEFPHAKVTVTKGQKSGFTFRADNHPFELELVLDLVEQRAYEVWRNQGI